MWHTYTRNFKKLNNNKPAEEYILNKLSQWITINASLGEKVSWKFNEILTGW